MSTPVRMTGSSFVSVQQGNTALVKQGESLQDIAAANKVSVESLIAANPNLKSAEQLQPGMELRLPAGQVQPLGGSSASTLPVPLPRPVDGFERQAAGVFGQIGSSTVLSEPVPSPHYDDGKLLSGAVVVGIGIGVPPGSGDPIPEGNPLDAVPLYHLQQALRAGGEAGATPINLANQTNPAWPGPVPPAGAEAGPPIGPDPFGAGVLFQAGGLRVNQDVPEGPAPDPEPIPEGKSLEGDPIGAAAQPSLGVNDTAQASATPIQIP